MADPSVDSAGESPIVSAGDLLRWAEALAGIARTGLGFTENLYERERFEEVLKVAADIRYHALEEVEAGVQIEEWLSSVGKGVPGYVTPKTAVGAVVGNDAGEILLVQRAGSGLWVDMAFAAIDGQQTRTFFDKPRSPTWRTRPGDDA